MVNVLHFKQTIHNLIDKTILSKALYYIINCIYNCNYIIKMLISKKNFKKKLVIIYDRHFFFTKISTIFSSTNAHKNKNKITKHQ